MFKKTHALWKRHIGEFLRKAGYLQPTPLQKKVIPLILKGKDIAIETGDKTGKTAAFILPILEKMYKNRAGIKALVLTSSFDRAKKITREFHKFIRYLSVKVNVTLLGNERGTRMEFRLLSQKPDIVVGTTSRVIDHIRRGNLFFDDVQFTVIDGTDMDTFTGFEPDIHFIATKLPQKKQTILFSPLCLSSIENLLSILRRPLTVSKNEWEKESDKPMYSWIEVEATGISERIKILVELIAAKGSDSILLVCEDEKNIPLLLRYLKQSGYEARWFSGKLEDAKKNKLVNAFNQKEISILITTIQDTQAQKLLWPSYIICFDIPTQQRLYYKTILTESHGVKEVMLFLTGIQFRDLKALEEIKNVDIKKQALPSDDDVVKGITAHIIKRIKEEEDPDELGNYKKMIKQNVPLFIRSYFMAYLFKEFMWKKLRKKTPVTTTLFISVGKNRHVFPNDLISLFTEHLNIRRSEVKDVKILDNYSFMEITTRYAARAISVLSGKEIKGKVINVNYARKKTRGRRSGNNNKTN